MLFGYLKFIWEFVRLFFEIKKGIVILVVLIMEINLDISGNVVGMVCYDVFDIVLGDYFLIFEGFWIFGFYDSNMEFV